ncbi:MAG: glycine cleavage system protein GcvH [Ectothiorhodospiraceae bacterium]|nr:glycine cleavage system protein GcvH [Ectothiorhodospiraceae bacterium]
MSNVPTELRYTKSHEWVRTEADGSVTIGITEHAQELLGDMVFIELPETEANYTAGDECAVVESVKAASDVYSPITGEITAVNEDLADSPETVNQDAFGAGWMFKMQPEDAGEIDELMDADAYQELLAEEDH